MIGFRRTHGVALGAAALLALAAAFVSTTAATDTRSGADTSVTSDTTGYQLPTLSLEADGTTSNIAE